MAAGEGRMAAVYVRTWALQSQSRKDADCWHHLNASWIVGETVVLGALVSVSVLSPAKKVMRKTCEDLVRTFAIPGKQRH